MKIQIKINKCNFFQPHLQGGGGGESTPGLYRRRRTGKPVHRQQQQSSPVAVAAAVAGSRRRRKISDRIQAIAAERRRRRWTGPQSWTCSRGDGGAFLQFGRGRYGGGWWQPCAVALKPEPAGRVGAQRVQRSIPRLDRHGGAREPRLAAGQSHEHAPQHRGARPAARVHL
jgi:hypothetical protein